LTATRALLLDIDGVLLRPVTGFREVLSGQYGITAATTAEFFATRLVECQLGTADLLVELERLLAAWSWPGTAHSFLDTWFSTERDLDLELLKITDTLRHHGTRIVLATMQEPYRMRYLLDDLGLARHCDAMLVTYEIGYPKSDPTFFLEGLPRIQADPTRTMFFDDKVENVAAARTCAIQAHRFIDAQQVAQATKRWAT
jgi:putative hydrolase of the HAD superfamily